MGKFTPLAVSDLAAVEEQLLQVADVLKQLNDRMMGSFTVSGGMERHPNSLLDAAKEVANEATTFYHQVVGRYLHCINLREIERKYSERRGVSHPSPYRELA